VTERLEVPKGVKVHTILDNVATHKQAVAQQWPAKHRRFHLHLTSTSSS